jgi:hypothetical protein
MGNVSHGIHVYFLASTATVYVYYIAYSGLR